MIKNPFVVAGRISKEYFCDRDKEKKTICKSITNGNNLVLISPRRMGKTGLIRYCFENEFDEDGYYTFFIDIMHTTSLQEFTYLLGRKIYEAIVPRSRKMLTAFIQTIKSISGQFGFDPITNTPTFNLNLGDIIKPELTLEEIFRYLENADKPCIMAIDEFQQIAKFPEKNIEALLRTHIQTMTNCQFIFAGSEYHVMQEIFLSAVHPFYNSADILELKPIAKDYYADFVEKWMNKYDKHIERNDISEVYQLFRGNTYGMQRTFNEVFASVDNGEMLSNIPEKQKPLLYAIAEEGEVEKITSASFIKKHKLSSASANQYAAKQLINYGIVTKLHNKYSISEQFFDIWINRMYGRKTTIM